MSEKDLVEVKLHDLFLAELALDLHRQQDFVEFTAIGLLRAEEEVARYLHGDSTAAARLATGGRDLVGRRQQRAEIDSPVTPELVVLDSDHGVDQVARNLVEIDRNSTVFSELGEQRFITIVDAQRHLVLGILEVFDRG